MNVEVIQSLNASLKLIMTEAFGKLTFNVPLLSDLYTPM